MADRDSRLMKPVAARFEPFLAYLKPQVFFRSASLVLKASRLLLRTGLLGVGGMRVALWCQSGLGRAGMRSWRLCRQRRRDRR